MTGRVSALLAAIGIFTVSCASKPEPNDMDIGLTLTNRAVNYELQGDASMAAYTYNRALAKFRDMGRFCDMARVALLMYTVEPDAGNEDKLEDAAAFAALGSCREETNITNFLTGNDYDYSSLEEPYKSAAKFWRDKDLSPLKSLASSGSTSDKIKSAVYRIMAKYAIADKPKDAMEYAEAAKKIDAKHAWTKNILMDEELLFKASEKLGLGTEIIGQRINILKQALEDKRK